LGGIFGLLFGMGFPMGLPVVRLESPVAKPIDLWDSWIDGQEDTNGLAPPIAGDEREVTHLTVSGERAVVRPRVVTSSGSMLLEDAIWPLVKAGHRGAVRLWGGPGSGKGTALLHLAALMPPSPP